MQSTMLIYIWMSLADGASVWPTSTINSDTPTAMIHIPDQDDDVYICQLK